MKNVGSIISLLLALAWVSLYTAPANAELAIDDDEADSTGIELYQQAGVLINQRSEFAEGDSLMLVAREKLRDTPFWDTYGATYLTLGYSYFLQRKPLREITEQFHKGLEVVDEHTDEPHRLRAMLYDNFTYSFRRHNATDSARVYVEKAIEEGLQVLSGEHAGTLGGIYGNAANIYAEMGSLEMAIQYYDRAESIFNQIIPREHEHWVTHYNNIGIIYNRLGDRVTARNYFMRSQELSKEIFGERDPRTLRSQLTYLREVSEQDDPEDTRQLLEEAKEDIKANYAISDLHIMVKKLEAQFFKKQGNIDDALHSAEKAIEIAHEVEDHSDLLFKSYQTKANVLTAADDLEGVDRFFAKAEELLEQMPENAEVKQSGLYAEMADVFVRYGHPDLAIEYGQKSLELNDQRIVSNDLEGNEINVDISNPAIELKIHSILGQAFADKYEEAGEVENLDQSLEHFSMVIDQSWEIRKNFTEEASSVDLGERLHQAFALATDIAYSGYKATGDASYIDHLMKFTQNSKATTLQNSLIESRIFETATIPEELRQQKNELQIEISHREIQLARAESGLADMDDELRSEYEATLFDLRHERDELFDSIKEDHAEHYNLHYEQLEITSSDLKQELSEDQIMLEYAIGQDQNYVMVHSHEETTIQPIETSLEKLQEKVGRFHELSSNRQVVRASLRNELYDLNDKLYASLIEPIYDVAGSHKEWVIIPDGPLHYIPFEMLINPDERSDEGFDEQPFLIKDHLVSYNYSPGLFAMQEPTDHQTQSITAFAPVFEDIEDEQDFAASTDFETYRASSESGSEMEVYQFGPLPESRDEVTYIADLAERNNVETTVYLDDEANRETLQSVIQSDIVHIATHGVFNSTSPSLSGLGLIDNDEDSDQNTMLYVPEIYNLDLSADLVILSSCESGYGEIIAGEGMMAMNRGFLQSGSNNVIYSMWKVSDTHTRDLMTRFYEYHLNGASYAEALRDAKLDMIDDSTGSNPAHWAAFMMIGR